MSKRVFFVSPEDLNVRICQAKRLTDTDRVFIISKEEDMPALTGKVREYLENKSIFCMVGNDDDFMALIESECNEKEDLYFIGRSVKKYYDSCKSKILDMEHKIGYNNTFGIQKTTLRSKETQQNMFPIVDIMNAVNSTPKAENSTNENESASSREKKPAKSPKESPKKASANETESTKSKENKKGTIKEPSKIKPKNGNLANHSEQKEEPIPEIIIDKPDIDLVADAKAQLSYALFVRLTKHIKQLTQKEYQENTLYQFINLLRKTEDPSEFQKSWTEICSDRSFKIHEEAYWILRNEATFYHRVCSYLYEVDVWTD